MLGISPEQTEHHDDKGRFTDHEEAEGEGGVGDERAAASEGVGGCEAGEAERVGGSGGEGADLGDLGAHGGAARGEPVYEVGLLVLTDGELGRGGRRGARRPSRCGEA